MADLNDTQVPGPGMQTTPVAVKTYKDALCFALEVNAILEAVPDDVNSDHMAGVQGIMKRISEGVHDAMSADDDVRGQMCNELRVVQELISRLNEESDSSLLYAAESLIDMTVASLANRVEAENV